MTHTGRPLTIAFLSVTLACAATGSGTRGPDPAPHSIYGTLTDVVSGVPIEGATVSVLSDTETPIAETVSDTMGRFSVGTTGPGRYLLRFNHVAYRPMRGVVTVPQNQIVEVRASVRQSDDDPQATYYTRRFNTNRCTDWSDYHRILGSSRTLVEWQWRLCDHSDRQYEVELQFRNPNSDPISFDYRMSGQRRMECSQVNHEIDPLSASLAGTLQIHTDGRARHRGRQGLVDKDDYTSYVHLCVMNWRLESLI